MDPTEQVPSILLPEEENSSSFQNLLPLEKWTMDKVILTVIHYHQNPSELTSYSGSLNRFIYIL
jgi:hypothetical protein